MDDTIYSTATGEYSFQKLLIRIKQFTFNLCGKKYTLLLQFKMFLLSQ